MTDKEDESIAALLILKARTISDMGISELIFGYTMIDSHRNVIWQVSLGTKYTPKDFRVNPFFLGILKSCNRTLLVGEDITAA